MDDRINFITKEMRRVAEDARESFGSLSGEQLNWKPAENSWSVAQCLDHIIKTNLSFYPEFDRLASGNRKNSFWENWSPFTGWGGRFLVNAVLVDSKKAKAPSKSIVPPSEIEGDIVNRFI
ncbi:MAG TPA: DinB family protein, partial [Pyrinomonadaceae bacterium]|nr:DinB family protein [Pyrinomonadaceae bacterium]